MTAINVFDKDTAIVGFYHGATFEWVATGAYSMPEFHPIAAGDVIRTKDDRASGSVNVVYRNAAGDIFAGARPTANGAVLSFTAPTGAVSFNLSVAPTQVSSAVVTVNQDYPSGYIPFGGFTKTSPWRGTLAAFAGDSITAGFGLTGYNTGLIPESFAARTCAALDMGERNYGISSSAISVNPSDPTGKDPMSVRYTSMRDDAGLIVVAGGTNDWRYQWTPLGTNADRTTGTFHGALHVLAAGLVAKYPEAQLVFCTPIKRGTIGPTETNENGETLQQYRDAIFTVCGDYDIPVCDQWALSGIEPHVPENLAAYVPDGTHPNAAGHALMADVLTDFLQDLQPVSNRRRGAVAVL